MKRIMSTLFLFSALFLLLDGCESYRGSATEVPKTEAPTVAPKTNTQEIQSIHLTDNKVKEILKELIPKAINVYGIFNGNGAFKSDPTKTIPGEKEYCLVTEVNGKPLVDMNNVKSIADLKKIVEGVFTKDMAQKLFYRTYLETKDRGLPLYKDYEGELYVNIGNGGHGWAQDFLTDTAKLIEQNVNIAKVELDTTLFDEPYDKWTLTIEYVNNKWLLASSLV